MAVLMLSAGQTTARIATHGGAVLRLDHAGMPLLRPAADDALPIDSACYPLVPFGNRIRDNRFAFGGREYSLTPNTDWDRHYVHGEGWRSEWSVTSRASDTLVLSHAHDGSALPYVYSAVQQFSLHDDGAAFSIFVTNQGDEPMPFGLGWHPYFPMTPLTTLQTETGRMWTELEGWLPGESVAKPREVDFTTPRALPHHWVNNGFEDWSGQARIHWPERGIALRIDADPLFSAMFLFVSDTSFDPTYQRDFFALEPMSHLADGHNLPDLGGLAILAPGETLAGRMRLTVEQA
jgi:aldose 1-epimerase